MFTNVVQDLLDNSESCVLLPIFLINATFLIKLSVEKKSIFNVKISDFKLQGLEPFEKMKNTIPIPILNFFQKRFRFRFSKNTTK